MECDGTPVAPSAHDAHAPGGRDGRGDPQSFEYLLRLAGDATTIVGRPPDVVAESEPQGPSREAKRNLPRLRVRPPRDARPLPGMRGGACRRGSRMKRLLRWMFNGSSVTSAALCLAACLLWLRNRSPRDDHLQVSIGSHLLDFSLYGGGICLHVTNGWQGTPGVWLTLGHDEAERFRLGLDGNHPLSTWTCPAFSFDSGFTRFISSENGTPLRCGEPSSVRPEVWFRGKALPFWMICSISVESLLATASLLPMWWLVRFVYLTRRRTSRSKRGLCPVCGYDLRATPDRCPECGAVPKAKGAA
jgi:hypothetical protein